MLEYMEVDSTPLQLKDMPDEVLFSIFEFLDAKSLKASRLVATNWNQIIAKSPKLMKKILLIIDGQRKSEFNQISNFSRCYQEIKFKDLDDLNITKNFIKNFREIGSKVKKVESWHCEISSELEDLIRCFPSADHFEFYYCLAKGDFKLNPEVFIGCKSLDVVCDQNLFFCFEDLQLTKLEFVSICSSDWPDLINYLARQTRLKTLTLQILEAIPPEVQLVKMQCPVENLSIHFFLEQLSPKLLEFLKLFGMTVKSLDVSKFRFTQAATPYALLDSISSNFKSLTHLVLEGLKFTTVNSNLEFLKPLGSVKTMELSGVKFETSEEFSKFFKLFPQLAEIKIPECYRTSISESREKYLQCLFKLENVKKFDLGWIEQDFVVLQNKHLSIKVGKEFDVDQQQDFYMALKIFKEFGIPEDELMKSRQGAHEAPEWKPVTEEDFAAMDEDEVQLCEIFDHFSVVIQKH